MKKIIYIGVDFETTYGKSLSVRTMGNSNYSRRTNAYRVSVVCEELGIKFVGHPKEFNWKQIPKDAVLVSHNAGFDQAVCFALIEQGIIPDFTCAGWQCSADLCAFHGLPRALDKASEEILGVEMDKGMRNYMADKTWEDAVADGRADELDAYAMNDSVVMMQIWNELHPYWPQFEQAVSMLNKTIERRGVGIDLDLLDLFEARLQREQERLYSLLPWVPDSKPLSKPACEAYCKSIGIDAPKSYNRTDRGYLAWQKKYGNDHAFIAARFDLQNLNKMLRNCEKLRLRLRDDNRIDASLLYFGAHTGRFSGTGGINLQNIETREKFGVNMRHLFVPAEGKKFVIVDAAQIEARIMSWIVGDEKMLEQIRAGVPLYEAHARSDMGWTGGCLKEENPELYAQAKVKVLSLNYGCGYKRFRDMAAASYGVKMSLEQAKAIHADYRAKNPLITGFWRDRDYELKEATNNQVDLEIQLPSKRIMRWREPQYDFSTGGGDVTIKALGSWGGFDRKKTYGGMLTENIIQAIARDILVEHMLEIEARGHQIVMTVHDEVIVECDEDQADAVLAEVIEIMSTAPVWAEGLPLNAEGGVHNHYDK